MCAQKQEHAQELSELHASHKQLKELRQGLDDTLAALQPAHAELQQMHTRVTEELRQTKAALQTSEQARIAAEVRRGIVIRTSTWYGVYFCDHISKQAYMHLVH